MIIDLIKEHVSGITKVARVLLVILLVVGV